MSERKSNWFFVSSLLNLGRYSRFHWRIHEVSFSGLVGDAFESAIGFVDVIRVVVCGMRGNDLSDNKVKDKDVVVANRVFNFNIGTVKGAVEGREFVVGHYVPYAG